ncbi:HAD family hydrolase [Amycolatopsis thermophila]|uniref:Phosphoglycolate phosphatase-like HAD superfamily hydrolase n=1 Tax=Amycolatopsis thermophila TaxID=206084 RepID=A0ABU0EWY3_9PSEU|nr:haloacid dehalogenase-like hydrolase [Amycolatopsis thermophila]MDQ0379797.1 phosphoglycolate phosphatase-like HAD superfamily hydrolase [Amycolatopsis thermophila]
MTSSAHRLVLWDIDQTLIDLRGAGRGWYRQVLEEVTGVAMTGMPDFFGRTERAITAEVLTLHGIEPTEDLIRKMWAALTAVSELALPELGKRGLALPGAAAALAAVAGAGGALQSLVTGNLREIAWHKLSAFGLHTHLDFEIGGYGDLSAHRPDLVAYAVDRAQAAHGTPFEPTSVIVVGDTPHDIDAARAHGAVAVGVATGRFDSAALREAGAHVVLRDLSDTDRVLAAVFG